MFKTKKGSITCSKLIINELAGSPARSENVYFVNNEQASIAVFTAVFCFIHAVLYMPFIYFLYVILQKID